MGAVRGLACDKSGGIQGPVPQPICTASSFAVLMWTVVACIPDPRAAPGASWVPCSLDRQCLLQPHLLLALPQSPDAGGLCPLETYEEWGPLHALSFPAPDFAPLPRPPQGAAHLCHASSVSPSQTQCSWVASESLPQGLEPLPCSAPSPGQIPHHPIGSQPSSLKYFWFVFFMRGSSCGARCRRIRRWRWLCRQQ